MVLKSLGLAAALALATALPSFAAPLKIGVVPVINLEWIQKIHRDRASRGYSTEAVTDTAEAATRTRAKVVSLMPMRSIPTSD